MLYSCSHMATVGVKGLIGCNLVLTCVYVYVGSYIEVAEVAGAEGGQYESAETTVESRPHFYSAARHSFIP